MSEDERICSTPGCNRYTHTPNSRFCRACTRFKYTAPDTMGMAQQDRLMMVEWNRQVVRTRTLMASAGEPQRDERRWWR